METNTNSQSDITSRPRQRKEKGIKRACNECRQQKLRCDVVSDPFQACWRCQRLCLVCKIDAGFKRVEKRRAKYARQQLETGQPQGQAQSGKPRSVSSPQETVTQRLSMTGEGPEAAALIIDLTTVPTVQRHSPAVSGLTSQLSTFPAERNQTEPEPSHPNKQQLCSSGASKDSTGLSVSDAIRALDGVELSALDVDALYKIFFEHYHLFLPFLDSSKGSDFYYRSSRLLFWTIISIASRRYSTDLTLLPALAVSVPKLMWSTLQRVTQNYHDVKALCLLCVWPFPRSSSSSDSTFMLSGTLMSLAMQMGLHRPYQAQDFSQFTMRIPPDEVQDRLATWATCKIVVQWVATGYGQSLAVVWDEGSALVAESSSSLQNIADQLKIEKLCVTISNTLSFISEAPRNQNDEPRSPVISGLVQDLAHLELEFADQSCSKTLFLYLHCARLHLRLYVLHELPTSPNYIESVLSLYDACDTLVTYVQESSLDVVSYCPNYVCQMVFAAGFSVLRISTSPIIEYIDALAAKRLFNSSITAIRKISITNNDIPARIAEVLVQLKARRNRSSRELTIDWKSLQLKVRSRLSMSISFDSLWEWRRGFMEDENGAIASNETPNATSQQTYRSPHTSHSMQDGETASSLPMDPNFDLNNMALDQFYPWMLENGTEMSNFSTNLHEFTA